MAVEPGGTSPAKVALAIVVGLDTMKLSADLISTLAWLTGLDAVETRAPGPPVLDKSGAAGADAAHSERPTTAKANLHAFEMMSLGWDIGTSPFAGVNRLYATTVPMIARPAITAG
jgi:hypothetical protein